MRLELRPTTWSATWWNFWELPEVDFNFKNVDLRFYSSRNCRLQLFAYVEGYMLTSLHWKSLEHCRYIAKLSMLYKIVHGSVAIPQTYLYPFISTPTRQCHSLYFLTPQCRTSYFQNSFFPSSTILWNSLPAHTVALATLESFQGAITY